MAERLPLKCPECVSSGRGGSHRIGNHKSACRTCNRFNQAVRRRALMLLKDRHAEEYGDLLAQAEIDAYVPVTDKWRPRKQRSA